MRILEVEPTVFFVRDGDGLRRLVNVAIESAASTDAVLRVDGGGLDELIRLGGVPGGASQHEVFLPDIRDTVSLRFLVESDGGATDERVIDWTPGRRWEVHLIQFAHHDLGYTDLPSRVPGEYEPIMDQVLDWCDEMRDWPEESKFRYSIEQVWSLLPYLQRRPPETAERLARCVREGLIDVAALFGNQTLELCSTEELVRLLYPAFRLKRELGIELMTAEHNDIPGFVWGMASVLAGAGIRYFAPAVPGWYFGTGENAVHPLWDTERALPLDMPSACWWEGPDGSRVLLWSDIHGVGEWFLKTYEQAEEELPGWLARFEADDYPYNTVAFTVRGASLDNGPPTDNFAKIARAWNEKWAYPRIVNTTRNAFLQSFEARWGDTLPTLRGDVPGTDYPVAAACTPGETAVDRNTHEKLVAAEKLATIASELTDWSYPFADLDEAWQETFRYDLHCWGARGSGGPAQDASRAEKCAFAQRAAALTHNIATKASAAILRRIAVGEDGPHLVLFNPLPHVRTEAARVWLRPWQPCTAGGFTVGPQGETVWSDPIPGKATGPGGGIAEAWLTESPFEILDVETGVSVPFQVSRLQDPQAARPWAPERMAQDCVDRRYTTEIALVARDLPATGYRTFGAVQRERWPEFPSDSCSRSSSDGVVVENRFYRLEVSSDGKVTGLRDRELDRDLIDHDSPHGLGQLIVRRSDTAEEETLRVEDVSIVEEGPLFTTVRVRGGASCCPRVTAEITLQHTLKRVELSVRILRDSTPQREVHIAFPFRVEDPRFRFEAPGSVIEPTRDQWPGSSTDSYGIGHWVDVGADGWGITWVPIDTPMAALGGFWPGYVSGAHHAARGPDYGHPFLEPGGIEKGHIYALVSYHNFRTNFVNVHPGELVVRYAFTSGSGEGPEGRAQAFGWQAMNPPEPVWTSGPREGDLPPSQDFCALDAPNVALTALKRAEDGNGLVLRMFETAGRETQVTVTLPFFTIRRATGTNLVEEGGEPLPATERAVEVTLPPYGIRTVRVTG